MIIAEKLYAVLCFDACDSVNNDYSNAVHQYSQQQLMIKKQYRIYQITHSLHSHIKAAPESLYTMKELCMISCGIIEKSSSDQFKNKIRRVLAEWFWIKKL